MSANLIRCTLVFSAMSLSAIFGAVSLEAAEEIPIRWQHLSSQTGDLPIPGPSNMQTGAVVADFDGDAVNDFILSFRGKPPALVWYRRTANGWTRYVIEKELLPVEAGGAVSDIDGDGDLDVVFGGDWQGSDVWWWENPAGNFDPKVSWKRRTIKKGGKTQHHDQVFADFLAKGKPQLAFWNQNAKTIFLAEIPPDPRSATRWPLSAIYSGSAGEEGRETFQYPEGMSVYDVDADGQPDLLAGNTWFQHTGEGKFKAVRIAKVGGLIFAGYFRPTKYPQIVIAPGDGIGPLRSYECIGNPLEPKDWVGKNLLDRDVVHGHSLQLADLNRDGHLDIFAAEMAKWHENQAQPDHPNATAWIFYGDGQGGWRATELVKGQGWHEARVRDLDGDGDPDILNKPYNWETPRVDVWLNNGSRPGASFHGPVGLQLYSLRDLLASNVPLGLQTTRNFGFVEVELAGTYGLPPAQFRERLKRHGLKPIAGHFRYELWEKDPDRAAQQAKQLGLSYAGCAWIPHQAPFDETTCRRAAAVFNRAGEILAKHDIRFYYHNHGYEFVPHGQGTLFDLLMQQTKPDLVCYEMDVFWTVHPGQDPVHLLQRYAGRWQLFHIKDLKKGVQTGNLSGSEDVNNDVILGTGQIDLLKTLRAAQQQGVKHYFIEDESPISIEQIPRSLKYLESLSW